MAEGPGAWDLGPGQASDGLWSIGYLEVVCTFKMLECFLDVILLWV